MFGILVAQGSLLYKQGRFAHRPLTDLFGDFAMKTILNLSVAFIVCVAAIGCEPTSTTEKKTETTIKTPGGDTKSTIKQKIETTPDSATKTTTEKVETTGNNPPPATKP